MKLSKKLSYIFLILIVSLSLLACSDDKEASKTNSTKESVSTNQENSNVEETDNEIKEINRFEGLTLTDSDIGIPVLYYHSIEPSESNELILAPERLREQLQYIKDAGYTTLTMREVYDHLVNNAPIPEKSILITFDDGYMDNYTYAYPLLKEFNMKATIFLMTVGVDEGFYISSDQMKEMSDYGIDIECHTINHVRLGELSYEEQLKEITESRDFIEKVTGKDVISIAYPYGNYNDDTLRAVQDAGYSLAFGISNGKANRTDNIFALNRIYVNSLETMDQFIYNLEQAKL